MKITDFYASPDREHWLSQLRLCDWPGGKWLVELIEKDWFHETVGGTSKLLLLTDGDRLVSFCTLSEWDDIPDSGLTPWVGFVYTYPEYRGRRCFGQLLDEASRLAAEQGFDALYISTDHIGLYEKYGCEYIGDMTDMRGNASRVYIKGTRGLVRNEKG
ncbi:MAG: GNAT family N-acetyltransferase [Ruminococcus sp.]|nr:GNAT family N-acetyltransferase [Ruminococcus sp.]